MSSSDNMHDPGPAGGEAVDVWTEFSAASSAREYYQGWLTLQSVMIPGVVQSLLVMADEGQRVSPVAGWPGSGNDPARLAEVLERVLDEHRGLLMELDQAGRYALAYPLLQDDRLMGVVALELRAASESDLRRAMELLQWGAAWIELLSRRRQAEEDQAQLARLKTAVDLLAATLDRSSFSEAVMTFVTELAAASGCERISMGWVRGRSVALQAVSHSSEVDVKMNLTRALERVMDEALLQRCEIVFPTAEETLICREHEALSRQQSMVCIAKLPLYGQGRYYGAMTCERAADQPFSERERTFFRAVAALVGPALESRRLGDRSVATHARAAAGETVRRVFGPGQYGRKLALLAVFGLTVFFSFARGEYRLSADVALEGAVRRTIAAPFGGFISQAHVRAGDVVEEGGLLCTLDDRDLHLQQLAKSSRVRQLAQQFQEASSRHERAQAGIIKAQLDQVQAELDLVAAQLARTLLTAPFSGLVVSGDLNQRLGSAVDQGDVLFEMTPLDAYRVILKVDERRIADVRPGQHGRLVLFSLPGQEFSFTVNTVTPIAKAEEGRNYFRVEAALDAADENLRPGMEVVGKIGIDRRRLISIWVRDMREWISLWLWKWLP